MKTFSFRSAIASFAMLSILSVFTLSLSRPVHAGVEIAPDGTCLVSGSDAYGAYMRPGYAVDPCVAKRATASAPSADAVRRATCPEMWSTVTNVSDASCRAPDDRRNIRHEETQKQK